MVNFILKIYIFKVPKSEDLPKRPIYHSKKFKKYISILITSFKKVKIKKNFLQRQFL